MSTKIENYNTAKRQQVACKEWVALIGNEYRGGGGGIGELRSLHLKNGDAYPTVYHQYRDGATNYHPMPSGLAPHLEAAIKARFGELVADALKRQDAELKAAAEDAVKEHGDLLRAAGLCA